MLPQLALPWPSPILWPNARKPRQVVAAHRADQRRVANILAMEARWHLLTLPEGVVELDLYFCPPTARAFDLDNAVAALKGALDGLSDACRVDDRWFSPRLHRGEKTSGGAVVVSAHATGMPWRRVGDVAAQLVKEAARKRVTTQAGLTETQANGVQGMAQAKSISTGRAAQ